MEDIFESAFLTTSSWGSINITKKGKGVFSRIVYEGDLAPF